MCFSFLLSPILSPSPAHQPFQPALFRKTSDEDLGPSHGSIPESDKSAPGCTRPVRSQWRDRASEVRQASTRSSASAAARRSQSQCQPVTAARGREHRGLQLPARKGKKRWVAARRLGKNWRYPRRCMCACCVRESRIATIVTEMRARGNYTMPSRLSRLSRRCSMKEATPDTWTAVSGIVVLHARFQAGTARGDDPSRRELRERNDSQWRWTRSTHEPNQRGATRANTTSPRAQPPPLPQATTAVCSVAGGCRSLVT